MIDLDAGEAETIILAEETSADLIIMDDRLGRKIAKLREITVIGTLRFLLIAKKRGLISSVMNHIGKLKHAGFWVSDNVCDLIREAAGEQ